MIDPKHENKARATNALQVAEAWPATTITLGSNSGIDGARWDLELVENRDFRTLRNHIEHLSKNSLYSNPFFAPSFLEAASTYLSEENVNFLCLSEITGEHRELKLFAPVTLTRAGIRRSKILRVWSHPYAPLSAPLVDHRDEAKIVEEFAKCLETASSGLASTILFEDLPEHSGFSRLIRSAAGLSDRIVSFSEKTRASVEGRLGIESAVKKVSGKRKQRLRKAREQLERFGSVSFEVAKDASEISDALTGHLELERSGWKGNRQSSILQNERLTKFAFEAIGQLTGEGGCAIHSLQLNGTMIASMILLHNKGHYFPWKIAFDEAYAKQSVGNLLLVHVNELVSQDDNFVLLDSLASELNKTARRFWPDELKLSNIAIGLGSNAARNAQWLALELELITNLKQNLKKRLGRLH